MRRDSWEPLLCKRVPASPGRGRSVAQSCCSLAQTQRFSARHICTLNLTSVLAYSMYSKSAAYKMSPCTPTVLKRRFFEPIAPSLSLRSCNTPAYIAERCSRDVKLPPLPTTAARRRRQQRGYFRACDSIDTRLYDQRGKKGFSNTYVQTVL